MSDVEDFVAYVGADLAVEAMAVAAGPALGWLDDTCPVNVGTGSRGAGRHVAGSVVDDPAPGTASHKSQRWADCQGRGGTWSHKRWSKQYDVNMRNARVGLWRESTYRTALGGENRLLDTPFGRRQIDVLGSGHAGGTPSRFSCGNTHGTSLLAALLTGRVRTGTVAEW